jgi:DNA mismatch endonuclease (patch repair protein)
LPEAKNEMVSSQMARMPRSSTGPEVALRRSLHRRGLRFRLHRRDLPGTPDIVLPASRLAVFVDGCYWHACPEHGVVPKSNTEWWKSKFASNQLRDARKDRELVDLGWTPVHVWEHEDPEEAADRISVLGKDRIGPDQYRSSGADCGNLRSTN